ncbi:MAG: hypothetical protein AAF430_10855 [Myxococcota bacterium]
MEDVSPLDSLALTPDEAVAWLRSVDGELYRTPPRPGRKGAWVAVVRTPAFEGERGRLIFAVGESAIEAAQTAAAEWRSIWERLPRSA